MAKENRPPYASQADVDRLFEKMRTIGDPGAIDRQWIENFGLPRASLKQS